MGADETGGSLKRRTAAAARQLGRAAKPHIMAPLRSSFWEALYQRLKGIRLVVTEIILALLALGAVILLIIKLLIGELTTPTTRISVAAVPRDLSAGGFTEAVAEELIYAELATIQATAKTSMKRNAVWRESQTPKFAVPGVGLDLGDLFQQVQQFFGKKDTSITVYVTKIGDQLKFTVRATQEELPLAPDWQIASNEFEVVQKAAEQVLRATQPYILASYLCDKKRREVRRDECRQTIDEIMRTYPAGSENLARAHNLDGSLLKDDGNYIGALAEYEEALRHQPHAAYVLSNVAELWRSRGELEKALTLHQQAIESDPNLALLYNNYGATLSELGRLDEAISEFAKSIKLDSKLDLAHRNLGIVLNAQGQIDEALKAFQEALNIDPQSVETHNARGIALLRHGRLTEAMGEFQTALEIAPGDKFAYANMGDVLIGQKRWVEAASLYEKALKIDPNYAIPHRRIGDILRRLGRLRAASVEYQKAIDLDPKAAGSYIDFGRLRLDQKRPGDALALYQTATKVDPRSADAFFNLGGAYSGLKRWNNAIEAYQTAVKLNDNFAEAWIALSMALAEHGKLDEAVEADYRATELAENKADVWYNLGVDLMTQCERAESAAVWYYFGLDVMNQCKRAEAISALQRTIELDEDYPTAHLNLGAEFFRQGKVDEAIIAFEEAVRVDQDDMLGWRNLCAVKRNESDAKTACKRALALDPDNEETKRIIVDRFGELTSID